MRLLSQNFLACLKCESYPLAVSATVVEEIPVEYDAEFTRRMLARIDYSYLVQAYRSLREKHEVIRQSGHELPDTLDGLDTSDDSTALHAMHYAMNVIAVRHGELRCPECGTTYAVSEFIPNFVLTN